MLGGYPSWPQSYLKEISQEFSEMTQNQRLGRRAGSELEAALEDPRWQVPVSRSNT
jgi:hypothetical protein